MRALTILAVILSFGAISPAIAADDFGPRFGESAPTALSDNTIDTLEADPAMALQNIEPAAGDEDIDAQFPEVPQTPEWDTSEDVEDLLEEAESLDDFSL